jgi:hypothetical protein
MLHLPRNKKLSISSLVRKRKGQTQKDQSISILKHMFLILVQRFRYCASSKSLESNRQEFVFDLKTSLKIEPNKYWRFFCKSCRPIRKFRSLKQISLFVLISSCSFKIIRVCNFQLLFPHCIRSDSILLYRRSYRIWVVFYPHPPLRFVNGSFYSHLPLIEM